MVRKRCGCCVGVRKGVPLFSAKKISLRLWSDERLGVIPPWPRFYVAARGGASVLYLVNGNCLQLAVFIRQHSCVTCDSVFFPLAHQSELSFHRGTCYCSRDQTHPTGQTIQHEQRQISGQFLFRWDTR